LSWAPHEWDEVNALFQEFESDLRGTNTPLPDMTCQRAAICGFAKREIIAAVANFFTI
jgi:hypothetical protein